MGRINLRAQNNALSESRNYSKDSGICVGETRVDWMRVRYERKNVKCRGRAGSQEE
jgi:hypothetical protein